MVAPYPRGAWRPDHKAWPQDGNRRRDDRRFEHGNSLSPSWRPPAALCWQKRGDAIMSPTLSRYLKDFSAQVPPPPSAIPDISFEEMPAFPEVPPEPPVDVEAERREAYAQGHEAATQEL